MKKAIAIAGMLALTITEKASFADHLEPKQSEIRPGGNFLHANLIGRDLSNANLKSADLRNADLNGITATLLRSCPTLLPNGWVCENRSLIQRSF